MKKLILGSILSFVLAFFAVTHTASAAIAYWDINDTGANSGQTAAAPFKYWSTASTNAFWTSDSTGASTTVPWANGDTAVFSAGGDGGVSFNVTNSTVAPVTVGGITVEEGTVNVRSSTLTVNGGGIFDIASGSSVTLNPTVAGTVVLRKIGDGNLFLGTANSRTNKTIVGGGKILLTGGNLTGLGATAGNPTAFVADHLTITNGAGIVINNDNGSATFTWPAAVGLTVGAGGGTVYVGGTGSVITGTGTKFSGGVFTKDGTNEFRNSVTANVHLFTNLVVKAGRWQSGSGTAIGTDTHFGAVPPSFLQDQITLDGPVARLVFAGGTAASNVVLNANRGITITSNGGGVDHENSCATIPGKITGPGKFSRWGTLALHLGGDNDFSGGFQFTGSSGVGRNALATGTGPVFMTHQNALGSGQVQFDVSGTIVPQIPGMTIPNKFFWNSTSQSYGVTPTTAASYGNVTATNNSATYSGDVNVGSVGTAPAVTFNGSAAISTFTGTITNILGFTKAGLGTMVVTGNNTYGNTTNVNGLTTVSAGTLLVNNAAGSGTGVSDVMVASGATLGGTGTISGIVTNFGTINAGASVGTLNTGSEVWSNSTLRVEINDGNAAEGVGHDFVNIVGTLNLSPETNLTVRAITLAGAVAGQAANFSSSNPGGYSWKIVTASGGISGFNPSFITINTGSFQNATDGGTFKVSQVGNDLFLSFSNAAHIVTNPSNQSAAPGGSAVFTAVAVGEVPITYLWKSNGVAMVNETLPNGTVVSGADTASLTLTSISPSDTPSGTLFSVAVTNNAGGAESTTATLTVLDPAITVEPTPLTIGAGSNAVFTVTAQGTPTLAYQWNKDSLPISNVDPHYTGVNSSTLTILNVSDTDEGGYDVEVTGPGPQSPALSSTVGLTVVNPPVISVQPVSITNTGGTTANFTVTATGDSLAYQWKKNGSNISGKTTSALSLPNVQLADAADYTCRITNFANSVTSSVASLSLQFTLSATSSSPFGSVAASPVKALYDANEAVQLTATAINPSFGFSSWAGGATGSVNPLNITMTTNTTITATFTSSIPDIIIDQDNANNSGGNTILTNGAWQFFVGGFSNSFEVGSPYYATNAAGVVTNGSTPTATYKFIPNIITAGNYDVYVIFNASAVGGNRATNSPWRVYGNSGNVLTRVNEEANNATFIRVATNIYFTAGSAGYAEAGNDVSLGIGGDISIADAVKFIYSTAQQDLSSSPASRTNDAGTVATFSVTPTFAGSYTYQWKKGGVDIGGETAASLTLNSVLNADEGSYTVQVTDGVTTNVTSAATLTVIDPVINIQPVASQTVGEGTNVTLSVTATGTSLTYQWYKGLSAVSGATDSSLSFTPAQASDTGSYKAVVTSGDGATSSVATVTVLVPVAIVTQPQSTNVLQGQNATFEVSATGDNLVYQWKYGGSDISGATGTSYTVINVQADDDDFTYSVTVSNLVSTADSSAATLTFTEDLDLPTVKITTPASKKGTNQAMINVTGQAKDKKGIGSGIVTSVVVVHNAGVPGGTTNAASLLEFGSSATEGKFNFSSPITLTAGTNTLLVYATDLAGNTSAVSTATSYFFFYDVTNNLTLEIGGTGSVKGAITTYSTTTVIPNYYKVGRPYAFDAFVGAGTNYVFTNWATSPTNIGYAVTNWVQKNKLLFVMQPEMTIHAGFLANPFTPVAGIYNGLFSEPTNAGGVRHESAGFVSVKVGAKSGYSGYLVFDGDPKVTFSGKFTASGDVTRDVRRDLKFGKAPVRVSLALDWSTSSGEITGTVTNGTWTSELLANLAKFDAKALPPVLDSTNFMGRYTMQIPRGAGSPASAPGGVGYGTITNNAAGIITLAGKLGDGGPKQAIQQKVNIGRNGDWPLYVGLYPSTVTISNALTLNLPVLNKSYYHGALMGWVKFTSNNAALPVQTNGLTGDVIWIKTAIDTNVYALKVPTNAVYYTNGFSNEISLVTSPYVPPGLNSLPIELAGGEVVVSDGDLAEPITNAATAILTNKIFLAPLTTNSLAIVTTNKMAITIAKKDGSFKGSYLRPGDALKAEFFGALLQNTTNAQGHFLGATNTSGHVIFNGP